VHQEFTDPDLLFEQISKYIPLLLDRLTASFNCCSVITIAASTEGFRDLFPDDIPNVFRRTARSGRTSA
jgi:hypothetical protein